MKLAYELRPTADRNAATALLVPGRRAEDVLRLCADLGLAALPAVHLVADGFVVKLPAPREEPLAGVVRLRGLAAELLLPVDALLVPPLLPDEAAALVRQRGLVFLPGGRVLEYDPSEPLTLTALLRVGDVERPAWSALPVPPAFADELTEIVLDVPDTALEVLAAGGEGIGSETAELPDSGLPSQAAGRALLTLGQGLAWLGSTLHLRGLAWLGATLLGGAMSLAPRLSERLLSKQEAMLRHLLRQFREGNIEEALRRALPLSSNATRGAQAAQDARLPRNQVLYSLGELLGKGGPASLWYLQADIQRELHEQYRKQAELAATRGDYRRAAFIYGKLLGDFHSAAFVLSRGGLHRDAATLLEQVVKDPRGAAREWEAAGEIERALRLYLQQNDHPAAGDLLRRAGEEERAVEQYQLAAAVLLESGPRQFEAGQLLETRARRLDLAMPYYRDGWEQRPQGSPVPCLLRLARHEADAGNGAALLELTDAADPFLEAWDAESASNYYNALARHAETPALAASAPELRDRARLGLARKLVQAGERRGGNYLATLFPASSAWPAPLVRDAEHALKQASRQVRTSGALWLQRRVRSSIVRAVCQLPVSKEVLLGLDNGELVCFRPATGDAVTLAKESGAIVAMVACSDEHVAVLSQSSADKYFLSVHSKVPSFARTRMPIDAVPRPCLFTPVETHAGSLIGMFAQRRHCIFHVPALLTEASWHLSLTNEPMATVLVPTPHAKRGFGLALLYPGRLDWYADETRPTSKPLPWTLGVGTGSLAQPRLYAACHDEHHLEIMAIDSSGGVRQTLLCLNSPATPKTNSDCAPSDDERLLAFARVRANLWACVTARAVHWLRGTGGKPAAPPTPIPGEQPVAAFALPATNDVLIVEADCSLMRVPVRG